MKTLTIQLNNCSYNIYISQDSFATIGEELKKTFSRNKKVFVITDENVDALYGDLLLEKLVEQDFVTEKFVIAPGEKSKSLLTLPAIYESLAKFKLTRSDLIIALGGGVVGDLAGFVAATFLRGVPYVQIPTSLLAQIDSSIGGKVAVDLPAGKNLVGSFYHPSAVFIDPNMLKTLPKKYFSDGMGEVIKYGCIKDKKLFEQLVALPTAEKIWQELESIIYNCCDIKRQIVERDEKDTGERMILNFGHTIGHALEQFYDYGRFSHGEAVAIGMYTITSKSEALGLTKLGTAQKLKVLLEKFSLPTTWESVDEHWEETLNKPPEKPTETIIPQIPIIEGSSLKEVLKSLNIPLTPDIATVKDLLEIIAVDKKNSGNDITLILLKDVGEGFLYKIPLIEVEKFI